MPYVYIPSTGRSLTSTFGQYYNRSSNSFSGIFGTATYPQRSLSGVNINYYTAGNYLFYLNIASSNSSAGSVSITYPWSESSSGTSTIGNNRQVYTGTYPYLSITAFSNYGYTFKGWYTLPSGGTQITSANTTNVYYTTGYPNTVWYAQWY